MPDLAVTAQIENDIAWIDAEFSALIDTVEVITPAEWAEKNRYMPPSVSPLPGPYRYDVAPFLREIVECLDVRSPVREAVLMKGAQIGATSGVLENAIGYCMQHVNSAPIMMMTADAELSSIRLDLHITPMIKQSGLDDLIMSADEGNKRKTGKTDKKIEWFGGGYLLPVGAKNAAKLRSSPVRFLLLDEIDGYPETVGNDGDPEKLAEARTRAYHQTRKVLRLSTPLIKGQSRIERSFKRGDQRHYHVPCRGCGEFQRLWFNGLDKKTGERYGLIWDMEDGRLDLDSVRYVCRACGHAHKNHDKTWMLPRGKWVPSAIPIDPAVRSYHITALYSPVSMFSWEAVVQSWLGAWDVEKKRPYDLTLLQEFYNNVLGESFEIRGERLRFITVSAHRRRAYKFGEIPNNFAAEYSGGKICLVNCAVDVHKENLAVAVFGWTPGGRSYLLDYWRFEGDPEQLDDEPTWGRLSELIHGKEYVADDGRRYPIANTVIDSGYYSDQVLQFCADMGAGVVPVKGDDSVQQRSIQQFAKMETKTGMQGFRIAVSLYKDRWSAALRRQWDGDGVQPVGHFNAPVDVTDKQLRELTVEQKRERVHPITKRPMGYEWYRPGNVANELWDLLIYSSAAVDILAWLICIEQCKLEKVDFDEFWRYLEQERLYYSLDNAQK